MGDPFRVVAAAAILTGGAPYGVVPSVTERRPRCGLNRVNRKGRNFANKPKMRTLILPITIEKGRIRRAFLACSHKLSTFAGKFI